MVLKNAILAVSDQRHTMSFFPILLLQHTCLHSFPKHVLYEHLENLQLR